MRGQGKVVGLRFKCPEDVQNTLIHHTKIKMYGKRGGDADACQCVENVNH